MEKGEGETELKERECQRRKKKKKRKKRKKYYLIGGSNKI